MSDAGAIERQRKIWLRALDHADLCRVNYERTLKRYSLASLERDNEAIKLSRMERGIEP